MADRTTFHHAIGITAAAALLVAMITSPMRSSGSPGPLSSPDRVPGHLAFPLIHPTHFSPKSVALRAAPVKAVPSENDEKKLGRAASAGWCVAGVPSSPSFQSPARALAIIAPSRVSQPLRC